MNALTILLALLVVGCGALEDATPMLDRAGTAVMKVGGCLRVVCELPLDNCRLRPGSCR